MATTFKKGIAVGVKGTASNLTLIKKGVVSVTVSALAAAAEEDLDITVAGAQVGDLVNIAPRDAAAEAGLMWSAWVSAAATVTIRVTNASGSGLTGSTSNWDYLLVSSAAQA